MFRASVIFDVIVLLFFNLIIISVGWSNLPIKYINGCQIDLDADGHYDLSLFIETLNGYELIILIKKEEGYKSYSFIENGNNLKLKGAYGYSIRETTSGDSQGRTFKTNGTYLIIEQPESSQLAIFWDGKKFKTIWLSD